MNFSNRTITTEADKTAKIGQKTFFGGGKKMFIEGDHYQNIYNMGEIGGETAKLIDESFFSIIFEDKVINVQNETILETIDSCIMELKEHDITPSIILIPSAYSWRDKVFLNDKRFIRKIYSDEYNPEDIDVFLIGFLDDIPVYSCFNDEFNNKVMVCNLEKAFHMFYRTEAEWYKNELMVEVTEITVDQAEEIYEKNPSRWHNRGDVKGANKENSLIFIRNAIYFDIASFSKFEIIDEKAYSLGLIVEKRSGDF